MTPNRLGNARLDELARGSRCRASSRSSVPARVSGDDLIFVREAVIAGLGIGVMPWFMASPEIAAGRITRVLPDYQALTGTMYVVYPPAKPLPPKVAAFTSYLVEHAPRLLGPQ